MGGAEQQLTFDWAPILAAIATVIDVIVKVAIIPAVIFGVQQLKKRFKIEETEQQRKDEERAIKASILNVEEQALKAWKNDRLVMRGPEKLELAKTKARELSSTGLASVSEQELVALIEAEVNQLRPTMSSAPPPPTSFRPPPSSVPPRV